jgi:hypothetical protein
VKPAAASGYLNDETNEISAMTEKFLQFLPAPEETSWISHDMIPRYTAADLAERTEALRSRVAELEAELAWYHSSFGHVTDGEIQSIINNL